MIQVVNLLRIYLLLHAGGVNYMRFLSLIIHPSTMVHVKEAVVFKIWLQICAMWDIKSPKGWMERLYEFYKLALQVTILIFWGITIYLMLFTDDSVGKLIGNYLPWFHALVIFFISWIGMFLAMPTLQKLLTFKCEAVPACWDTLLGQQRQSYKRFIFLHGRLMLVILI
jgi:hypothetical protein